MNNLRKPIRGTPLTRLRTPLPYLVDFRGSFPVWRGRTISGDRAQNRRVRDSGIGGIAHVSLRAIKVTVVVKGQIAIQGLSQAIRAGEMVGLLSQGTLLVNLMSRDEVVLPRVSPREAFLYLPGNPPFRPIWWWSFSIPRVSLPHGAFRFA